MVTEKIKEALIFQMPILLYGNIKSIKIDNEYCIIDAREIIDLNSLTGSYVFEEKNFIFKKGPLFTEKLLFIKNIDLNLNIIYYLMKYNKDQVYIASAKNIIENFYPIKIENTELLGNDKIEEMKSDFFSKKNMNLYDRLNFYFSVEYELSAKKDDYFEQLEHFKNILFLTEKNIEDYFSFELFNNMAITSSLLSMYNSLKIAAERTHNILFIGETGVGKTTAIQEYFKYLKYSKKQFHILNMSASSDISDLMGTYIFEEGRFLYRESNFLKAIRNGDWILLDEINLAPKFLLDFINAICEKRSVYNFDLQEEIKFHPEFFIIGAMNEIGKRTFNTEIFKKTYIRNFFTSNIELEKIILKLQQFKNKNIFLYFLNVINNSKIKKIITGRVLGRILKFSKNENQFFKMVDLLIFSKLTYVEQIKERKYFDELFTSTENIPDLLSSSEFIITQENRFLVYRILNSIEFNLPVLLSGETATGKTSVIYYIANLLHKKVIRINNHRNTELSEYVGTYKKVNNKFIFEEGPLIEALKNGDYLLLDEMNLASSDILESLNRLLDENKEIYIKEIDQYIKPHPDFRLFATQNEGYLGRSNLTEAFLNRFAVLTCPHKTNTELKNILSLKLPVSFINKKLEVYNEIILSRNLAQLITIRELKKWVERLPYSFEESYFVGMMILYESQSNSSDRNYIQDIFNRVYKNYIGKTYGGIIEEKISQFFTDIHVEDYALTADHKKLIYLMHQAWENSENILVEGETGIGKTRVVEILGRIYGQNITVVQCNGDMDISDLLGSYMIDGDNIQFTYGPVIQAIKNDNILLIDEINLCDSNVIERINSLLDRRSIYINETRETFNAPDKFKIVAMMNPSYDFGKKALSPALKNRFTHIYFEIENYTEIYNYFDVTSMIYEGKKYTIRDVENIKKFENYYKKNNIDYSREIIYNFFENQFDEKPEFLNEDGHFGFKNFLFFKENTQK